MLLTHFSIIFVSSMDRADYILSTVSRKVIYDNLHGPWNMGICIRIPMLFPLLCINTKEDRTSSVFIDSDLVKSIARFIFSRLKTQKPNGQKKVQSNTCTAQNKISRKIRDRLISDR